MVDYCRRRYVKQNYRASTVIPVYRETLAGFYNRPGELYQL